MYRNLLEDFWVWLQTSFKCFSKIFMLCHICGFTKIFSSTTHSEPERIGFDRNTQMKPSTRLHTIYNAPRTLLALHLCNHLVSKLQLMHYLHTPAFNALGICIILPNKVQVRASVGRVFGFVDNRQFWFGLSQNHRTGGSIYLKTLKGPVDFMEEPVKKGWSWRSHLQAIYFENRGHVYHKKFLDLVRTMVMELKNRPDNLWVHQTSLGSNQGIKVASLQL